MVYIITRKEQGRQFFQRRLNNNIGLTPILFVEKSLKKNTKSNESFVKFFLIPYEINKNHVLLCKLHQNQYKYLVEKDKEMNGFPKEIYKKYIKRLNDINKFDFIKTLVLTTENAKVDLLFV